MSDWDLVVIGGGSAGLTAARTAARFGASVLLVESDRLGGDCLWTGCIPSKALIAAGQVGRPATPEADAGRAFSRAMADVHQAIAAIAPTDSHDALKAAGVAVRDGEARFTSPRSIEVDGETISFAQALICTGTSPRAPRFSRADTVRFRTSDDVWNLPHLPERLIVLGGGPTGCELGQAMARLGAAVTIVHRGERLLPDDDEEASAIVTESMERDGIDVRIGRTVDSVVSDDGDSGIATLDNGDTVPFDALLSAVGREPHTQQLKLTSAAVATSDAGYITVDAALRTSNPRIWAAGDVTGMPYLTHLAGVNGSRAATNAILGLRRKADAHLPPRVTFTSPEVASVGVPAKAADPRRHTVITWPHEHADRAIAMGDTSGYTRIVVDRRGRIVGGAVVGPRAGETIGEISLAVRAGLTTSTVTSTTHPYPTYNDSFWNAAIRDWGARYSRGVIGFGIRQLRRLRAARLR